MYNIKPMFGFLANAFVLGIMLFGFSEQFCAQRNPGTCTVFLDSSDFPPID